MVFFRIELLGLLERIIRITLAKSNILDNAWTMDVQLLEENAGVVIVCVTSDNPGF